MCATCGCGDEAGVLLHLGFAVSVIDELEAQRAMSGLELIGNPREGPDQV